MRCLAWATVGAALIVVGARADDKASEEFVALFPDEGTPKGWSARRWDDVSQPADSAWAVRGGVLDSGRVRGNWLMSDAEYGDFELEFEFKLGKTGNSGLALRSPMKGDPAFDGMEVQMADLRYNPKAKDSELTGGLYRAVAPRKQVYKPEQWNRYEIRLVGSKLRAVLNGELIHDVELAEEIQIVKRHDGTDAPAIKDRPRRGRLGFQNLSRGGSSVQIRNARLKLLE